MTVSDKALNYAIKTLNAIGATYHVVTRQGISYGAPIEAPKEKRTRVDRGPSLLHLYGPQVSALQVGESVRLTAPDREEGPRFMHNAASFARNRFGNGSIVADYDHSDFTVEILRIE